MAQHHNYNISDLENMLPFERDIFVNMLKNYLEKLEAERKQQQLY